MKITKIGDGIGISIAWTTLIFETYPPNEKVNHFYTEKTFRGLMSGNAFILAIDNDKLRYLQSKGFWILNTDRDIEIFIIW